MRIAVAIALISTLSGCRLSAPFYAFKTLEAPEKEWPEQSLIFGRIVFEGALTTADAEAIYFERLDRSAGNHFYYATENTLFRVFQHRPVKDGYFVVAVPPGVYEFAEVQSAFLWQVQTYKFMPNAKRASRFHVTRPGIYDVGTFRVRMENFAFLIERAQNHADHRLQLRSAVAGTGWTRYLPSTEAPLVACVANP